MADPVGNAFSPFEMDSWEKPNSQNCSILGFGAKEFPRGCFIAMASAEVTVPPPTPVPGRSERWRPGLAQPAAHGLLP